MAIRSFLESFPIRATEGEVFLENHILGRDGRTDGRTNERTNRTPQESNIVWANVDLESCAWGRDEHNARRQTVSTFMQVLQLFN